MKCFPVALLLALPMSASSFAQSDASPPRPAEDAQESSASAAEADRDAARHVLVFGSARPWIAEIRLIVDGKPQAENWEAWLAKHFAELDVNDDGHLDGEEMGRLATESYSRNRPSTATGILGLFSRPAPSITGDDDGDGKVTRDEFAAHYREQRKGPFRVEEQTSSSGNLSESVRNALDADGNGLLEAEEIDTAAEAVRRLDKNEDELLAAAELGTQQGRVVFSSADMPGDATSAEDVVDLPVEAWELRNLAARIRRAYARSDQQPGLGRGELRWSNPEIFECFDADDSGRLDDDELAAFLKTPVADVRITVRFRREPWLWTKPPEDAAKDWLVESLPGVGKQPVRVFPAGGKRFRIVTAGDVVEFLPPVSLDESARTLVRNYEQQFDNADVDDNEYLERDECERYFYFNGLFDSLDADEDGKVFPKELRAFLDAELASARARMRLVVADRGRNLFDLLDGNRNGTITPRELVTASQRTRRWDRDENGLAGEEVPRFLRLAFRPDRPDFGNARYLAGEASLDFAGVPNGRRAKDAPAWFRGMDRNNDGDVSRREFLGPLEDFTRLDTEPDGLLSIEEAKSLGAPE